MKTYLRRTAKPTEEEGAWYADDLTEDSFKLICLGAHHAVGNMISRQISRSPLVSILAVGVPMAKYNDCNLYGDWLGDQTNHIVGQLGKPKFTRSHKHHEE